MVDVGKWCREMFLGFVFGVEIVCVIDLYRNLILICGNVVWVYEF